MKPPGKTASWFIGVAAGTPLGALLRNAEAENERHLRMRDREQELPRAARHLIAALAACEIVTHLRELVLATRDDASIRFGLLGLS